MGMLERDYILRMIQQLAQALGRILGLKRAGKLDEALLEVRATADGIFGPMRRTLEAIDAQSAASLLGNREKIEAYAALTAEEASIHELLGDARRARGGERRALSLYLEVAILGQEASEGARAAIEELRRKVDESRLPPRYREALRAFN
jgi:hypothetical protein